MENYLCKQYSTVDGGIPCSILIVCIIFFVYISTCFYSFVFSSSVTGTKLYIRLINQKSPNCMVLRYLLKFQESTNWTLHYSCTIYMRNIIWPNYDICYVRKLSNNRWLKDYITLHYRQLNTSINRIAKRWLSSRSNNPLLYICLFMVCAYDWLTLNAVLLI